MHVRKALAAAIAAAGIVATTGLWAATGQAASRQAATAQVVTTAVPLPIAHYSHMLVDPAHHHLFFSSGAGYSSILVTDYAGKTVATISGEPGATGLALSSDGSTVYAALANGDAVSAISTSTLAETARYPTGSGTDPTYVAYTSGRIWFGYGGSNQGGIGSIDPSTSTVTLNAAAGSWYAAPLVTATPGGELVAGEPDQSPDQIASYNVSSGTATVLAPQEYLYAGSDATSNLGSMQITPDGQDVVTASSYPGDNQVYRVSDLSADGTYTSAPGADSVSIAADGLVAAGMTGSYENAFFIFAPGESSPLYSYNFGANNFLATDGLALTPDSSELFAITGASSFGDSPTLNIIPNPGQQYPIDEVQGYHSLCLDNYGSSTTDGSKIDLYTCNGTRAQQWTLDATQGSNGNYTGELINSNGMCANDAGYGGTGSKVILWSCTGTSNEDWTYWPEYREYSVTYGGRTYCMNDPGYSTTQGTQQIVWTCPDTANEQYTLPH